MKRETHKVKLSFASISILLFLVLSFFVLVTQSAFAQEEQACQHDPFPSDAMNVDVSCDDPSCNVGPCTNQPTSNDEGTCWHNPTKENPPSRAPNTVVPCDDPTCNEGPCTTKSTEVEPDVKNRGTALSSRVQERIRNLAANMSNRMDAVVLRFEQIINRIETRMAKLEAEGVDASIAKTHLDEAETALTKAKDSLFTIDDVVANVTSSEKPRDAWQSAKNTYQGIRVNLHTAHNALRATVAALKDAIRIAELGQGVSDAVRNSELSTSTTNESGISTNETSE